MKKLIKYLFLTCLSVILLAGSTTNYFAATATLTNDSQTVRAGDTITLSLKISDDGKYGMEGTLEYDTSIVTLVEKKVGLDGWKVEENGNDIIVYDDNMSNPLNGLQNVLTLKFKVNSEAVTGAEINISVKNIVTTDGNNQNTIGVATYSTTVARPLSANANLTSLKVNEGTLSPAFSASKTSYDLGTVEYSVSKLTITATAEDSNAKVTVKNNSLKVGSNTVSVVVTAENGSTKTYKITVTRKQDPNYQASSNAKLSKLTLSAGTLSPAFSADVKEYVVYLPYEYVDKAFTATGKCADVKAQGVTDGVISKLVEGINKTTVIGKAENGSTMKYNVTVVVMPKYEGTVPNIGEVTDTPENPEPSETEEPTETEEPSETEEPTETESESNSDTEAETPSEEPSESETDTEEPEKPSGNVDIFTTILVVLVVIALVGVLAYVLFFSNKKR